MSDENKTSGVRAAIDSTVAIAFSRLFMPTALAIIGYFMVSTLADLKASQDKVAALLNTNQVEIATIKEKIAQNRMDINKLTIAVFKSVFQ